MHVNSFLTQEQNLHTDVQKSSQPQIHNRGKGHLGPHVLKLPQTTLSTRKNTYVTL